MHPSTYGPDAAGGAPQLELLESTGPDGVRLSLAGELDMAGAPHLTARLEPLARTRTAVLLDLSELEFMDSSGLCVLVNHHRRAAAEGWTLRVEPQLQPAVRRLLELTGFEAALCS